ncbi:MAG: DUF1553 domain-containing protein [Candidatus Hydrogenedentes bacterium]|nr:DUF1553 domain-containing protein [Candidatus Hydrogenedentota bacterium]
MNRIALVVCLVLACLHASVRADSVALLPQEVALGRAAATHRLLVERESGGLWRGEAVATQWVSSNEAVATVAADGTVAAIANGEATITATIDGQPATAKVIVSGTDQPFNWSFRNHVQPVLYKMGCNTGACHGAAAGKNGFKLSLRGFDHEADYKVLTREVNGRRVSLAEPEDSLILLKPTMAVSHEGGERFTKGSKPYQILRDWITAGAPPAHADDPVVERLEVFPPAVTLKKEGEQQLVVRAHYSNGTYEDVTPWVKYGTTDDAVAVVDDNGKVKVTGSGSTAITLWYASRVLSAEVSVPREKPVPPEIFAQAKRSNFVDDEVLKKLESLQIAPAGDATDAEFIRRAFLDCIGTLPTPEEVSAFIADQDAQKRAKLIDALLERPEFVDYWTYKWSDLMLLSSKQLARAEELNSFYGFIRESVQQNKPWDQFARDIVTAKGNTLENGAGVFYIMHKETTDLTETTSQAFLGMSVTCARCHNHPLEKWTQNDYYGMANLLSRVKLKVGLRENSTDVVPASFGDILHPRLARPLPPKPLDGEAISLENAGDRREVLAAWLTSPKNPYFTRAIVNRVWTNFMGRGIVHPEDDLRLTNPPSNEALLAALAKDTAEHGWDVKHLIRTIMNSASYQRSSQPSDPEAPDDKYYSQYIIHRLKAEVILDAYAQVTGVATPFPNYPEGYRALQLRDSQVASYFLTAFGRPERKQTCACERSEDTSIAQTLHIANGDTLNNKLKDDRSIVGQFVTQGLGDADIVNRLFILTYARYPSTEELDEAVAVLADVPHAGEHWPLARREAVEDLAWALLSSKEFLFNH